MTDLLAIGLPILAVDVLNPVLLAIVILALTNPSPLKNSLAIIAGHTFAYTLAGALFLFGLEEFAAKLLSPLVEWFNNPHPEDYILGLIVGILLLVVAARWRFSPPSTEAPRQETSGGLASNFALGAMVNFVGIPFAIPYFGFLSQAAKQEQTQQLLALLVYNLAYAGVFLLLPLAFMFAGQSIMPHLRAINEKVDHYSGYLMPILLGLLGLTLTLDSALFFATGTGLI